MTTWSSLFQSLLWNLSTYISRS